MEIANKPISVLEAVNEAIEKTKVILFRPFNLEKWMIIGFCAWLANLLQGGGGGGGSFRRFHRHPEEVKAHIFHAIDFCRTHLLFIIPAAVALFCIIAIIIIILLWLSSRGKFMFVDCLAKNKAHIIEPWKTFKKQANGLFGFRLLLLLTVLLWVIALAAVAIWFISLARLSNAGGVIIGLIICAMIFVSIIISLFFFLIRVLTFDFVVPIMFLQKTGISASWAKFSNLLWQNFWSFALYLLFKLLIFICIAAIVAAITIFACCCLCGTGIILFIPYIGTVIFLPLISFQALYSLCYLRKFGTEYDVFAAGM